MVPACVYTIGAPENLKTCEENRGMYVRPQYLRGCGIALLLPSVLLLNWLAGPGSLAHAAERKARPPMPPVATAPSSGAVSLPPAEMDPKPVVAPPLLANIQPGLQELVSQHSGDYGVAVLDVTTGETVGIGSDDLAVPAASTFKLPMAIYILQQADQGKISLDEKLTLTDADWEDGTGVLQDEPVGNEYTIGKLIDLAIEDSDNIATNMLLRRFGRPAIWALEKQLGGKYTYDEEQHNITSAGDLVRYMRAVLDPKVLTPASRDHLLGDLTHTEFAVRIRAGVPDDIPVAHKIGSQPNVVNDVGLVEFPGHPYILSVVSQNMGEEEGDEVIAAISRGVYGFYSGPSHATGRLFMP